MRVFSTSFKSSSDSKNVEYIQGYNNIIKWTVHVSFVCYIIGITFGTLEDFRKLNYFLGVIDIVIILFIAVLYLLFILRNISSKLAMQFLSYLVITLMVLTYIFVIKDPNFNTYLYRDVIVILILLFVCSFTTSVIHSVIICCFSLGMFITVAMIIDNAFLYQRLPNIILFVLGIGGFSIAYNHLLTSFLNRLVKSGEKIKELSEYKQNLIRLTIHDLKVPTNSILNICENNTCSDMKKVYSYADILNKELGNILDIDKLEDSGTRLDISSVDIRDLITESVNAIEIFASRKLIDIKTDIVADGILSCDRALIFRVLVNLLNNAIKYAKSNSIVSLKVANEGSSSCRITVHNTGSFIEKQHLPYLFDKFYCVRKRGTSGDISSSGLGLAFCKLAIQVHSGEIEVTSSHENGTAFSMLLPQFQRNENEVLRKNISPKVLRFSEEERNVLLPFCEELENIPIYKATEVITIMNKLHGLGNNNIQHWKQLVCDAIYTGDKELFEDAISLVKSGSLICKF